MWEIRKSESSWSLDTHSPHCPHLQVLVHLLPPNQPALQEHHSHQPQQKCILFLCSIYALYFTVHLVTDFHPINIANMDPCISFFGLIGHIMNLVNKYMTRKSNICIWLPVHSGEMSTCGALGEGWANVCFVLENRRLLGWPNITLQQIKWRFLTCAALLRTQKYLTWLQLDQRIKVCNH